MLASFVGDPAQLTPAQMDRWCKDFDNWAFCDAMSFNLFDRSPHAWAKVAEWSSRQKEFEKRTAFALLWSLSVHDKRAGNDAFVAGLALIEREAGDDRNFVKKAVNMALRAIGKRNRALNAAAVAVARRLAESDDADGALGWRQMRCGSSRVRASRNGSRDGRRRATRGHDRNRRRFREHQPLRLRLG